MTLDLKPGWSPNCGEQRKRLLEGQRNRKESVVHIAEVVKVGKLHSFEVELQERGWK